MIRIKIGGLISKDPQADEPFFIDWSDRLGTGVGIASSSWTATGLTSHDPAIGSVTSDVFTASPTGQVTKVHLSGGTLNSLYKATNTILTDETPSRTLDGTFAVLIQQE